MSTVIEDEAVLSDSITDVYTSSENLNLRVLPILLILD